MRCDAATSYSNLIDKSKTTSGDDDGDSDGRTIMTLRLSEREEGVAASLSSVRPASKSEMLMESGDLIKPRRRARPIPELLSSFLPFTYNKAFAS